MTPKALKARTAAFARQIVSFCDPLLDRTKTVDIGRQLLRAGTAVDSNYGSAQHGRSHDEFTSRIGLVLDEASESRNWIGVLRDSALVADGPAVQGLWREADELTRIFAKSYETARRKQQERRTKRKRRPMNRWTDEPINRWTDESMNRWTDESIRPSQPSCAED